MAVEKVERSLVEVFDRVLDKGIVIDAWVRVALAGIDLITVEARIVVASIETYLQNAKALAQVASGSASAGDWGMDGFDGFEAAKRIRLRPAK